MPDLNPNRTAATFTERMLRGSAWMIAMRWSMRLIGLVSTLILVRLLLPSDFGIVAMAMIIVGLLDTVASTGVDLALIRDQDSGRDHYDTAWTIQVLQGAVVAALLIVVAPFAGSYFAEPRVVAVIQLLSLKALLDGFRNIGTVAFRKEFDFAKEFHFNVLKKLIVFVIVVTSAFLFRNYWALVTGMVTATLIGVWLSYRMHPYRPRFTLVKFSEIWAFSQWWLVARVGGYLSHKADQFVVGGITETTTMGAYHVAHEIATMPVYEIIAPVRHAFFPTLSKLLDDPREFAAAVLKTYSTIAILCSALGFGLAAVADTFVPVVLGAKWTEYTVLIRWLAWFGVFVGLTSALSLPLLVHGRTRLIAAWTWLQLLAIVPALVWATRQYGVEGAAATRTLTALAFLPLMMYFTSRACQIGLAAMAGAMWRPLAAGIVMTVVLDRIDIGHAYHPALNLVFDIALGALVYISVLLLSWWAVGRPAGVEQALLGRLARALRGV